jgi:hypothetical protein
MALYVQVVNGQMAQCIDTTPPSPVGTDGWKNAVEIKPTPIPYQQGLNGPVYHCDLDPVEITWTLFAFTIEEQKGGKYSQAAQQFDAVVATQVALETNSNPDDHYDPAIVAAAQVRYEDICAQIAVATTQEQLDIIQQELDNNTITTGL